MNRRTFLKATAAVVIAPTLYAKGQDNKLQWRKWSKEKGGRPNVGDYFLMCYKKPSTQLYVMEWVQASKISDLKKEKEPMSTVNRSVFTLCLAYDKFDKPPFYGNYDMSRGKKDGNGNLAFMNLIPIVQNVNL